MKKTRNEIKAQLGTLSEKELRAILCQIFNNLNFSEVIEYHGVNELGKDIVFMDTDKFQKKLWYACVVKATDVKQPTFDEIARQVNECFRKKYPSHSEGLVPIKEVIVITSGIYKDNAKVQIADLIVDKKPYNDIQYWDVGDIAEKIEKAELIDILFNKSTVTQTLYNKSIFEVISDESSLKILENDFDVNIGKLDDFQIKVRAKSTEFENEREEYLKAIDIAHTKIPSKFLPDINVLLKTRKPILVHGIATAGKTTILKKLGKDFIKTGENGYVFFLELSKYKDEIIKDSFVTIVQNIFYSITKERLSISTLEKDIKVLVLLDGLDEIPESSQQDIVIKKALDLSTNENIRLVISSRTSEYISTNKEIKDRFNVYELLPLSFNEMVELGGKILVQEDKQTQFVKLIKKNEIINSFPKTPLTTILLAVLFKENKISAKELPRNITELYSKFIDVFLNKWDKNKGISQQFKHQEKQFIIQKIAEHLQNNNATSIKEDELVIFINDILKDRPIEGFEDATNFIKNICDRSSILVKDNFDNSYKFFHLTIQEYLTASILNFENEELLLKNYYDNWWLNTNIFYAGKTPHKSNILQRVATLMENYPADEENKLTYIIHTSKILQAAHLLDNKSRISVLNSMIKIFDDLLKQLLKDSLEDHEIKSKRRTILEFILWGRRMFYEFFNSAQFTDTLDTIRKDLLKIDNPAITDITEYCIAYALALSSHDSLPLYEFIENRKNINPRWYKIVGVDVSLKNLKQPEKKISSKFKTKAIKNKEYIQKQFREIFNKHYNSITGIEL